MNWRDGEQNPQILQHSPAFFPAFRPLDHGAALKIERKMLHLNIAFDRYASICTVMHYILVISERFRQFAESRVGYKASGSESEGEIFSSSFVFQNIRIKLESRKFFKELSRAFFDK